MCVCVYVCVYLSSCFRDKADSIYLLLALPIPGFLAGPSGISVGLDIVHQRQTRGFGWITFGWANCIIDTFVLN